MTIAHKVAESAGLTGTEVGLFVSLTVFFVVGAAWAVRGAGAGLKSNITYSAKNRAK